MSLAPCQVCRVFGYIILIINRHNCDCFVWPFGLLGSHALLVIFISYWVSLIYIAVIKCCPLLFHLLSFSLLLSGSQYTGRGFIFSVALFPPPLVLQQPFNSQSLAVTPWRRQYILSVNSMLSTHPLLWFPVMKPSPFMYRSKHVSCVN